MDAPPALVAPAPPIPQPGQYADAFAHFSRGGVAIIRVGPGLLPACPMGAVPFRDAGGDSGLSPGVYKAYRLKDRNVIELWKPEGITVTPPVCVGPNCRR